jgi:hypothetical protein
MVQVKDVKGEKEELKRRIGDVMSDVDSTCGSAVMLGFSKISAKTGCRLRTLAISFPIANTGTR